MQTIKDPSQRKKSSRPRVTLEDVASRTANYSWGYTYLSLDYTVAAKPNVTYLCPTHGEVTQGLHNHLSGSGCRLCGIAARTEKARVTLSELSSKTSCYGWDYKYKALDYSVKANARVTYVCRIHGEVTQSLQSHLAGHGCSLCSAEAKSASVRFSVSDVKEAVAHYGRNYSYLSVDYPPTNRPNVTYLCPVHGSVTQGLYAHLNGGGCSKCRKGPPTLQAAKVSAADSALLAKSEGYKALRVDRSKREPYIVSMCPDHGEFSMSASRRITEKRGCPACARIAGGSKRRLTFTSLVERARSVHGDTYEYVEEVRDKELWLHVVCKTHGGFLQRVSSHLGGHGCVKCKEEASALRSVKADLDWIVDAKKVHGDTYKYEAVIRNKNVKTAFRMTCEKHGEFVQDADNHINGSGCPSCVGRISKANREISEFLTSLGVGHEMEASIPGTRWKLDLYIPEKSLGIELNGIYWHSDEYRDKNYHADKQAAASAAGIRIIHIFDDEWAGKRGVVEASITNALGKSTARKVSARDCTAASVPTPAARVFMDLHHIQGFVGASGFYGLYLGTELVALGGFSMKERGRGGKASKTHAELARYCTSASVRGGLSKILKYAQADLGFSALTTFSDIRFFEGKSYEAVGFTSEGRIPPDYFYCKEGKRIHKSSLQKSRVKAKADLGLALYDPMYTELELSKLNGYSRVWDCGKIRWVKHWQ